MADKPVSSLALPGYGLLAVALALVVGVSSGRKGEEKKPDTGTGPSVPAVSSPGEPKGQGYLEFLKGRGVLTGANGRPVANTRFLILTLPDPIDSQLGYWYDQSIDALTRAMTDSTGQYVLADRWFPWAVTAVGKSKDPWDRTGSPKQERAMSAALTSASPNPEPGVMIYRKHDNIDERIVVLVVGENPLSGLNVPALMTSLDLASQGPGNAGKPIPLVGPFCTGSQASLGRTVREWAKKGRVAPTRPVVSCITGTALGLRRWEELEPKPEGESLDALCGQIHGTQAPFDQLRLVAMHYLSQPGRMDPVALPTGQPKSPVAYLVEANSGFGEAVAKTIAPPDDRIANSKSEEAAGKSADANTKERAGPESVFRFPMHIGRLAAIRSKEARERDQRLGLIQPGDELLLATDASRSGGDLIPSADEIRTALLNQRLLADYWAQIRREHVRYIWVIATDKRDVLFLLEQIQDACPDARPVVFGADLHYVHPDYQRFMRGVLVVGTYPLYPPAQRWQMRPNDPRRMPFPSSNAEGVYNAVLATLDSRDRMADYRAPFGVACPKPPVWVTTIGENSEFVPLGYSTGYDDANFLVPSEGTSADDRSDSPFGRPFFYLVGIVVVVTGFAAWWVWTVDRRTALALRPADGRVWVPGLRAQYVTIVGIGGVFAVLPLVLAFASARTLGPSASVALWASVAALALVAVGMVWYVRKQAILAGGEITAGPAPAATYAILAPWQAVAFALLVGGTAVGWLLADHSRLPEPARWLFAERSANLATGCSPVLPAAVIALGLLGHGLMGLHHVRLMSEFRVTAPYPQWEEGPPPGVAPQNAVAIGRVHAAVREIDVRFRNLLGVFTDPGHRTGTRWGRLLVWGTGAVFATALTSRAIFGAPVREPIFYGLGIALLVTAAVACVRLLRFVWRYEGRVPVAHPRPTGLLLAVIAGAACAAALARAQQTWESHAWNCLFATGCLALAVLTLASGYRIFLLWKLVEKITRAIALIPMVGAFDRFPDKVSRVFGAYLLTGRRRTLDLAIPLHLLEQLRMDVTNPDDPDDAAAGAALSAVSNRPPVPGTADVMEGTSAGALSAVAAQLVSALAPGWGRRGVPDAFGTVGTESDREAAAPGWRGTAEQFVAIMAVIFLSQYFARMRCLATMTIAPAAALLLAVTAYQFDPEQYLMYTAVGFAGAVIALLVWLLYKINRNEIVSRATRSTPNKFQPDAAFVQNLTVFVLPLAAVVVTQLAGRMRSVLEPILGWIR